jgi:FkbM family methyltransferase
MLKKIKYNIGLLGVWLIKVIARALKLDLIKIGYAENGILKSHSFAASGEQFFVASFLKKNVGEKPTFIDVGGNVGVYTSLLHKHFPNSQIHTFEPNPNTYKVLLKNCGEFATIVNKGIGEKNEQIDLFFNSANPTSEQASSNAEILKVIANSHDLSSEKIDVITLDDYAKLNNISTIDFLKIDVEGYELEAILGAKHLIQNHAINIIQFEFNEVNVVKRRFLKDFYDVLVDFDIYRLDEKRLIPLNAWEPFHEIFKFQNIIAIHK